MPTTAPGKNTKSDRLIVAGASVRQFVVGASQAGIDCLAIDLFCDWDTKKSCETITISKFDDLPELLSRLPRSRFIFPGGLENHFETLQAAAEYHQLLGPRPSDVRRSKDVMQLQAVCSTAEIAFPKTILTLPKTADKKWLIKPLSSAGGHAIEVLGRQKLEHENYLQAFVHGHSYSAVFRSLSHTGDKRQTTLIGTTEQLIGEPEFCSRPFAYCGSIGPISLPAPIQSELQRMGEIVASEFSLDGIFGIDFIVAADTGNNELPVLIEINPRVTASCELFELAGCFKGTASTVVQQQMATFDPKIEFDNDFSAKFVWGKAIVFSQWAGEVVVDQRIQRKIFAMNSGDGGISVADIPNIGAVIKSGGPIATVYGKDMSAKKVRNRLTDCAHLLRSCFQR